MVMANNNDNKRNSSLGVVNENNEKTVSIASNTIIHEKPDNQKGNLSRKSSLGDTNSKKGSLVNYKKNSLCEVYTIYDGVPVTRETARKSIISIQSEKQKYVEERWYQILIQVAVPFFIAGIGTIGAGIVLTKILDFRVFKEVEAFFVLIPSLLGLKGNLDMCLASRLSTQSNLGNMKNRSSIFKIVSGNILLVQIQAIVASCVVSVFTVISSAFVNGQFKWANILLLATTSTLTATLSCFVLDLVLVTLIILSKKINLNPDNIATPMAASIGDVITLITMSFWARLLFSIHDTYPWLMPVILPIYVVVLLPAWIFIVKKNDFTRKVLTRGWVPVITALFISGSSGLVLGHAHVTFEGYSVFQPIINGIGGNLVSVQASRISTMLHKTSFEGVIPLHTKQWVSPFTALITGVLPAKSARILLILSIPGHIVFVYVADLINSEGTINANVYFVFTYTLVGLIQIIILLYVCHLMVHTMWIFRIDPDNSAIPYLTALGDLLGSTLLWVGFIFTRAIKAEYI